MGETSILSRPHGVGHLHRRMSSSAGKRGPDADLLASAAPVQTAPPPTRPPSYPGRPAASEAVAAILPEDHRLAAQTTTSQPLPRSPPKTPTFLSLPLEIRLQIYAWVHRGQDARSNQATVTLSWMPDMGQRCLRYWNFGSSSSCSGWGLPRPYKTAVVGGEAGGAHDSDDDVGGHQRGPRRGPRRGPKRLSPDRPSGQMVPAALLCTCRQVYHEARRVPFVTNEFVFELDRGYFASALSMAHAFVVLGRPSSPNLPGRLQDWQRAQLRYLRLELDVRPGEVGWRAASARWGADGDGDGDQEEEEEEEELVVAASPPLVWQAQQRGRPSLDRRKWTELCEALSPGLQGLRLSVAVDAVDRGRRDNDNDNDNDHDMGNKQDSGERRLLLADPARVADSVLAHGLYSLHALRQLEIEIVSRGRDGRDDIRAGRVGWCAALQTALDARAAASGLRGGRARVLCVERMN